MGIPRTIEKVLASTPEAHPATIAEVLAATGRRAKRLARMMAVGPAVPSALHRGNKRTSMHEFLVSAAAFIVLVGVMVVVHEFGHFAVAKLCGVRVESFSVGFGPRLFGVKYGETDYKVCLLPLGGYVKMTGESAGTESRDARHAS